MKIPKRVFEINGPLVDLLQQSVKFIHSEKATKFCEISTLDLTVYSSVNRVVEFPGAGLGRLITINSELNGAI